MVPLTMLTSLTSAGVWARNTWVIADAQKRRSRLEELSALEHLMATGGIMAQPPGGPDGRLENQARESSAEQSQHHQGCARGSECAGA